MTQHSRLTIGLAFAAVLVLRVGAKAEPDSLDRVVDLARRTLTFVEKSAARPELAAELRQLEQRVAETRKQPQADLKKMEGEARSLRRRIILSHPLLNFDRLLITKRGLPVSHFTHQCDQYYGRHSQPGPGLVVLDAWKENPKETVERHGVRSLLEGKLPTGTVLNPELSYDAKRVIFSFCDATVGKSDSVTIPTHPTLVQMWKGYDADKVGRRRYFIYEATIDGKSVRQLTGTSSDPMETMDNRQSVLIEDLDPCYLPDGGFVFASTRSQNFGRCHWGRYTPSFLLYRADADGSNVRPLSFGESNEWDPTVLPDGRIIYTRWDYINRHDTFFQSLWVTRPDGTATAHYYGNNSRNPCVIAETRAIPGSHKVVATATAHHYFTGGSIILVDPHKGQDGMTPLTRVTPEVAFPETEGWGMKGVYCNPYPLSEDLFLVSYAPETLASGSWPTKNAFGIYLIDSLGGRELIYRDAEFCSFNPIPVQPRPVPRVIPSSLPRQGERQGTAGNDGGRQGTAGNDGGAVSVGTCYVQNVQESTYPLPPIKFLRINQIFNQPTASAPGRGRVGNEVVKGVVGTVPVNADGSVAFTAPAGVPLQLQALDENGMAVMTMRSLIYLQLGEKASCVGCHEHRAATPRSQGQWVNGSMGQWVKKTSTINHQPSTMPLTVQTPRPLSGPRYAGGFSFMRTVQPVLDRYCISCHGLGRNGTESIPYEGKPAGNLNLLADHAYHALVSRPGLVSFADNNAQTDFSRPRDYFAIAGKLGPMLVKGHENIHLPQDDLERIIAWLDLNAQQYGDYSFNRVEDRAPSPDGEKALRVYIAEVFGKDLAAQPFRALVNVGEPDESRILKAPLSIEAGGWGQIPNGWKSADDPGYPKMKQLVENAIAPLPYHDIAGTCSRIPCVCGSCWVRLTGLNGRRGGK